MRSGPFLAYCLLLVCQLAQSQNLIPNAGFEDWTANQPDFWNTSNFVNGQYDNVTPVEPGRSGDRAVRGEVRVWPTTPGFPHVPQLSSKADDGLFPIAELFPALRLYYKFHPGQEGDVLKVFVGVLGVDEMAFGGGSVNISTPSDTFTLLEVPIYYNLENNPQPPYQGAIAITIDTEGAELPAIGGYFIVDDLEFGDELSGKPDKKPETLAIEAIYPNPVVNILNIPLTLSNSQAIQIDLFDLTGRRIADLFSGKLSAGEHLIPIDLSAFDLPAGMYLCRMQTKDTINTQKLRLLNH